MYICGNTHDFWKWRNRFKILDEYENCRKCMKGFIDDYYKNKEFSYDELYEKAQNLLKEEKYYKICDGFYTAIL